MLVQHVIYFPEVCCDYYCDYWLGQLPVTGMQLVT